MPPIGFTIVVKFNIFKDAAILYNSNEVIFLRATDKAAIFEVGGKRVRLEITPQGTKFICDCEAHMHKMLQDKLCKRVIAVLIYIYIKRGGFKSDES